MADFNTNAVKHALYEIVREHGDEVLNDTNKFIALMSDYIPDNDRERRLLKHVLTNGVLATMRREDNQKIAIMKSREDVPLRRVSRPPCSAHPSSRYRREKTICLTGSSRDCVESSKDTGAPSRFFQIRLKKAKIAVTKTSRS